jgi:hypothetical protein
MASEKLRKALDNIPNADYTVSTMTAGCGLILSVLSLIRILLERRREHPGG